MIGEINCGRAQTGRWKVLEPITTGEMRREVMRRRGWKAETIRSVARRFYIQEKREVAGQRSSSQDVVKKSVEWTRLYTIYMVLKKMRCTRCVAHAITRI